MSHPHQGFYAAYFTGAEGPGLGMFVVRDGAIVGSDVGGIRFDGEYEVDAATHGISGRMRVTAPGGTTLIQGTATGPGGITYEMRFTLPADPQKEPFIRIETPYGPVNVRFVKLREL